MHSSSYHLLRAIYHKAETIETIETMHCLRSKVLKINYLDIL